MGICRLRRSAAIQTTASQMAHVLLKPLQTDGQPDFESEEELRLSITAIRELSWKIYWCVCREGPPDWVFNVTTIRALQGQHKKKLFRRFAGL